MNSFIEMHRKLTSSPYHSQMVRFAAPLCDHFGINHFWYYKITSTGNYSYVGTHGAWNEFCFEKSILQHFTCVRHPDSIQKGISLMKTGASGEYKAVLDLAWEKFTINFNINMVNEISQGVEAFGFATCFNDFHAEERLLNNLLLLKEFTKIFKANHQKLLRLLDENHVNLFSEFGQQFYERPKSLVLPFQRDKFLSKIGFEQIVLLTSREKDVLKFVACGYPAAYIAKQLYLTTKTVENYLSNIKSKLHCNSKVELIQKAQQLAATGYFDFG